VAKSDKRARKKENVRAAREARDAALRRGKRRKNVLRIVIAAVLVGMLAGVFALAGGGGDDDGDDAATTTTAAVELPAGCTDEKPDPAPEKKTYVEPEQLNLDPTKTYVATFDTTCGEFEVTLDQKTAPQTVNSFVFLAREGFYDGLTFHRVAKDFVVQGGDPTGTGTGGPGYQVPDEPPADGYEKGSVAMANSGPGTTGSQFFVALTDRGAQGLGTSPPYSYSALGEVTKGFENVEKLGSLYNRDQNPADPSTQKTAVPLYMFEVTVTEQ
jgi:cyclophilin family peptidyl-prolyl cis-trans isomerase